MPRYKILTLRPSGAGAFTQLTPVGAANNWDCVNDTTADEDSTYIENTGTNRKDYYTFDTVTARVGSIYSLTIVARSKSDALPTGDGAINLKYFINSTEYGVGGSHILLPLGSYGNYQTESLTNPDSSAAWTWADVAAMQFGVSHSSIGSGATRTTQLYCEVKYMPGVFFRDGAPSAGTAFEFFAEADNAIRDYMTTAGNITDINNLVAFLAAKNVTFRPGRYDIAPDVRESPSNFPIVYIGSFLVDAPDLEPRTQTIRCQTVLRVWCHKPDPLDAQRELDSITSAILSILRQSDRDTSNADWRHHYANHPQQLADSVRVTPATVETDIAGATTGRVSAQVLVRWLHSEDL